MSHVYSHWRYQIFTITNIPNIKNIIFKHYNFHVTTLILPNKSNFLLFSYEFITFSQLFTIDYIRIVIKKWYLPTFSIHLETTAGQDNWIKRWAVGTGLGAPK